MILPDGADNATIRLWDLPVRLIHWSLVVLMPMLWWSWKSGDLALHKQLGLVTLALVAFRLMWGLVGSHTARFASFLAGPRAMLDYVACKRVAPVVGHNPVGGWSTVLLLGLLATEVALGLFAQDIDAIESGPLSYLVTYDAADAAREWHDLVFDLLLAFIALHIAAILFYLVAKRDNLIGPMVTGRKAVVDGLPSPMQASPLRIIVCAIGAATLAYWISLGCPVL